MITIIRKQRISISDLTASAKYLLDGASHDEDVRQLALNITSKRVDSITAIYDWVKENVRYTPDPIIGGQEVELFISPIRMVKDANEGKALGGDCDDMALLTVALYRSIGIKANMILIDTDGGGLNHAIARVYSEKTDTWLDIDPSSEVPVGWEEKCFQEVTV